MIRGAMYVFLAAFLLFNIGEHASVSCALTSELQSKIAEANKKGPYLGLIIPNSFELNPLLENPGYTPYDTVIDFAGKRFRFGAIGDKPVVLVMTGLSLINAGITTQLLLSFFAVEGVVHCGIAGNANPSLHIGDVAIPKQWAHLTLWSWQRHGLGPNDTLPLEDNGDYTRKLGFLKFADFTTNVSADSSPDNQLNNIWYQPEEIFPVDGVPEQRQHAFWVPVDSIYYSIAEKLQGLKLESCVNSTTCLNSTPKVQFVKRGISQSIYVDNLAYRTFIYNKFEVSPVDMETASVALICLQQRIPFIAIRALSDLAGGGSAESNEADTFLSIAAANSVTAVIEFVKLLSSHSK
ncbi:bark storage protein A [Vigna radiata var. radiata]|uniref:Bark storage protein A n=1 Tax=Vigna radiata var. radiata TaxID=3916 RepID=A0A1S3U2X4_VIGRR|nr:bark storage protein A [Vigna radiata var. radiata]